MIGLFIAGAAVTYAVFTAFVPGPERGMTFYVAVSIVIAGEFVFFSFLAHGRIASTGRLEDDTPVRMQVSALIILWLVLAIVAAAVIVDPDVADTATADKILGIYAVITFLFFGGAYFIYSRALEVEVVGRELDQQRRSFQTVVPDVERAMDMVREVGDDVPEHAALADRAHKKLDTVRSALEGSMVSERALENPSREVQDVEGDIREEVGELIDLSEKLRDGQSEQAERALTDIARKSERLLATLKKRDRLLM